MDKAFRKTASNYSHGLSVIPYLLCLVWFFILEQVVLEPEFLIGTKIDKVIPFSEVFVIPYVFWYLYVAVPAVYFFFKAPDDFRKLMSFMSFSMIIACLIFTFFPNGQALRPYIRPDGLLDSIISKIYKADTPTNSLPSIHVMFSVGVHTALVHYKDAGRKILNFSFVSMVLICISTVFVKQHSIVDVMAGIIFSELLYILVYIKGITVDDIWKKVRLFTKRGISLRM
jgi:membrane-associated phospholipid phosphatase